MYAITHAEPLASDQLWAGFAALRLLEEAEMVLHQTRGDTAQIIDEVRWRNDSSSVRSLQRHLDALAQAIGGEITALGMQQAFMRGALRS